MHTAGTSARLSSSSSFASMCGSGGGHSDTGTSDTSDGATAAATAAQMRKLVHTLREHEGSSSDSYAGTVGSGADTGGSTVGTGCTGSVRTGSGGHNAEQRATPQRSSTLQMMPMVQSPANPPAAAPPASPGGSPASKEGLPALSARRASSGPVALLPMGAPSGPARSAATVTLIIEYEQLVLLQARRAPAAWRPHPSCRPRAGASD